MLAHVMQDGMEQLAILLFALKDVCMVFVNLLKYANATIYGTAPVATTQYVIVDVYTELALHHVPALVTLAGLEPLATRQDVMRVVTMEPA